MIAQDRWYVIAETREIGKGAVVKLRRFAEDFALFRTGDGVIRGVKDRCPHRGASLSMGHVKDDCIVCPFHGFAFQGDGTCVDIPALGPKGTIPKAMRAKDCILQERHGWIWLWTGAPRDTYPDPPYFDWIDGSYLYSTIQQEWPVHITRAIENQLDSFHLPFVHEKTIGRFVGDYDTITVETRVNEAEDRIKFWHKEFAGDEPPETFFLEYAAPNVWINGIGGGQWIVAAFVPVDDDHTITYVRLHQNRLTLPIIGPAMTWLVAQFNHYVLGEDRAVVSAQRPIRSELRMDEVLIPQDRPIIEYRRMCERESQRIAESQGPQGLGEAMAFTAAEG